MAETLKLLDWYMEASKFLATPVSDDLGIFLVIAVLIVSLGLIYWSSNWDTSG